MQVFLEVQKSAMLAYLAGRGSPRPPSAARGERPAALIPGANRHDRSGPRMSNPIEASQEIRNGKPAAAILERHPAVGPDRTTITSRLLETVRDRTGYPIETLGLDLDIEADLGIDSIKRVEILGKLRDEFSSLKGLSDSAEVMDELARARTLGIIVDRMAALSEQACDPGAASPRVVSGQWSVVSRNQDQEPQEMRAPCAHVADRDSDDRQDAPHAHEAAGNGQVQPRPQTLRRMLEVVAAPLSLQRLDLMRGGRIVITEDRRGVAEHLAGLLEAAGFAVQRLGGAAHPVDWTSPSSIDSALQSLRTEGPLPGIVHALPLGQVDSGELAPLDWSDRVRETVTGLFLLARAAAADLEAAARSGGACLIAATALGGRFASSDARGSSADFFPGQGGVAGLVKTLAREWALIRCRAVDLAPDDPAETLAQRLADEVFADEEWAEVGYDQGCRCRLQTVESPLRRARTAIELEPGEPVLISGGARGITALTAAELARTWRPTLLILGTTPLPAQAEPPDTAGLTVEAEIKAALHARLRRQGQPGSPGEIEAIYQAIRRAREVRENLAILRTLTPTVEYAQADVRDESALARVLGAWRARHGDPVGLIHGAGLIKDKLIRQKTLDSFESVLATKFEGALNLLGLVRPESLRFTALFSSIAGRYGNIGQSDYAAANEILNKLAHWLDRRWTGRVVSLIWGPWSGVGMVSQLEDHLGRRGLGMIAPDMGRSLLIDELRYGCKGDVEVIYSGELGTLEQPIRPDSVYQTMEVV
jgi:NAD(P)-dependent dehydrogenase (short-subunit alcohol dehydrogenase family)